MNILLLSTAARGHALAMSLVSSAHNVQLIHCSPHKNPGIRKLAAHDIQVDITNPQAVLNAIDGHEIDFAVVGPEDPLGAGIVDALNTIHIPCVGPTKKHAQIEASKGFTRNLLERHGINASPKFQVFTPENINDVEHYIQEELHGEYVVKYDALLGGKGVKLSGEHLDSVADGVSYATECIAECGKVVIEEKLIGTEFSLISFVSGTQVIDCPAVQDHKRAFTDDTGPNTGGMGTYSDANHSLPFLDDANLQRASELNTLTAEALQKEFGTPYKGILYGGFIVVKDGVRLIEYNARFGDPEALNILPLLQTDFVDVCQGIIHEDLSENMVQFAKQATVCKYIVPEGYPNHKKEKGMTITLPDTPSGVRTFIGSVDEQDDGSYALAGSRAVGVVGIGETLSEAEQNAEAYCASVEGPVRYRSDIGTESLIQKRIALLQELRQS